MCASSWCHPKPVQHPAPLFAIACGLNKAAVTRLLLLLELAHANVQDRTSLEVFIPSVSAT